MKRQTQSKKAILNEFKKNHLLTPKKLIELLSEFDRATIYRNLKSFEKEGVLKKIAIDSKESYYELSNHDHAHFKCNECGNIEAVDLDIPTKLGKKYIISDITLHGSCSGC